MGFFLYCIKAACHKSRNEGSPSAYEGLLRERRLRVSRFKDIPATKGYEKDYDPMSAKVLKKMIKKFKETGSSECEYGRGRKSIALTSAQDVATPLQEGQALV